MQFKTDFETVLVSVSGVAALAIGDAPSAVAFGLACSVFMFTRFIERKKIDDMAVIQDEIQKLKNRLEHIQLGKVVGR